MLKTFKQPYTWLALIVLAAIILRFYRLGSVPRTLNRDEAAIGYNAYSILQTGRDEWGEKFPFMFRSIGDYKSPLYIYLTVIPTALLGISEWSTRFWSAISGIGLVLLSFLITRKITAKQSIAPLIVSAMTAIASWNLHYSRIAFESHLSLWLNIWALYLLLFSKRRWTALIPIGLSLLCYSSALIIWPIFMSIYLILHTLKWKKDRKKMILWGAIFCLLFGMVFSTQAKLSRAKQGITVFSDPTIIDAYSKERTLQFSQNPMRARVFWNKYVYYSGLVLKNYLKFFRPDFLFRGGSYHPWHKIPSTGHFYWPEIITIMVGLGWFIKTGSVTPRVKILLGVYFLCALIPSAITTDAPHATRSLNAFFLLTMLSGGGLSVIVRQKKWWLTMMLCLAIGFCFVRREQFYFCEFVRRPPSSTLPSIKDAVAYIRKSGDKYQSIVFDRPYDSSYLYALFYLPYDPARFMTEANRYGPDTVGLTEVKQFGRYSFMEDPENASGSTLYICQGSRIPAGARPVKIITNYHQEIEYSISAND